MSEDKIKKCLIAGYDLDIITQEGMNILWNYITNLQEENENKDNKILELQQELLNKKLNIKDIEYKEKMIYKSRNEKAIEHIKGFISYIPEDNKQELIDILKGN